MDFFARTAVQKGLNEKARILPPLVIDGNWGPATTAALKSYQGQNKLPLTGLYDSATQDALGAFLASKYLATDDLELAAFTLEVTVEQVLAVSITESKAAGFFPSGDCQILFERHKMYAALAQKLGANKAATYARMYPGIVNSVRGGYLGGQQEYRRLNQALTIDRDCALASTSWGLFQIMGFNYADCGYPSVEAYVADMKQNEKLQLQSFVKFIQQNNRGALWTALKAKDWTTFAGKYNGTANVPVYAHLLDSNFTQAARYLT